jgi:D-tyrosyl-tRNA(Tyr) deacylase
LRAVVQRVSRASVSIQGQAVATINEGLVVLLGVAAGDSEEEVRYLADKIANLRILPDEADRFNLSAMDTGAEVLVVSQFTLLADTRKGRRPSFTNAAPPEIA